MDLVYTSHALEQMAERAISKAEVQQVVDKPDMTLPSHHAPNRRRFVRRIGGRRISVIIGPSNMALNAVITAWSD